MKRRACAQVVGRQTKLHTSLPARELDGCQSPAATASIRVRTDALSGAPTA
jgi:hypothetical protein